MSNGDRQPHPAALKSDHSRDAQPAMAQPKGRHLILFTISFPYDQSETFLESELPIVCRHFAKVTIVPMVGRVLTRAFPANVNVEKPFWSTPASRNAYFVKEYTRTRTWSVMIEAWRRAIFVDKRFHPAVLYRIFNWGSYRSALEAHPVVKEAIADPEDVVAYSYWAHTSALALPALAKAGVACAVRYHGVDLYKDGMRGTGYFHRNARYFPWREEIARAASLNIFISEQGRHYFEETWPGLLGATGCLCRLGAPAQGERAIRAPGGRALVIVSSSSIVPLKRVDLIAILTRELAKHRPVVWHHFGDGDSVELKRELESTSDDWRVELHGWVANSDLMEFYRTHQIDLFVNLSTSEGIPVSIMEAISFGIPVVATDVGGTSEAVITGRSGLLIGVDDALQPGALAGRILAEMEPDGCLTNATPRTVWEERFDADVNYADLAARLTGMSQSVRQGVS